LKRYLPFIILAIILLLDQGSKILVRQYFNPVEKNPFYGQTAGVLKASGLGEIDLTVSLPRPPPVRLAGDFFWINFHENKGVAFGLFSSLPQSVAVPLFTSIALLALAFIVHFYRSLPAGRLFPRISLMFIMGGAVGNLIDRVALGKVTDFFDLTIRAPASPPKNLWPIFNVADSFIVCGVILLFIIILFEKKEPEMARENGKDEKQSASESTIPPSQDT
jgi:signal peptidase II